MSRFEGPQGIVTNGLILNLDAGDPDSYTRSQPPYVEVLVVAGGGSGGSSVASNGGGGGGGAGGVIYNSAYQLSSAAAVTVTVGFGGPGQTSNTTQGNNGSNSVFGSLTAVGGGGGGSASGGNTNGGNGGSGGGAGYVGYYNNFNSGTGTAGQGFRGGFVLANNNAGGGGGAGGVGEDTYDSRPEPGYPAGNGGLGGPGVYYSISGTSTLYSTGGNGGSNNQNTIVSGSGTKGIYGSEQTSGGSATAASGIVIVRYPGLPAATGGTITYLNGYTIHTFTSSGTFTPYTWNDVSGNNNNGTLNNGTAFIPNIQGGYFNFDGTDDNVTIPNSSIPSTATTNKVSICFWSYGVSETTANSIIEGRNSNGDRTVNIHMPWVNNVIYWDSPDRITYSLASGQSLGWHYWSFTKDPSTGVTAIYQDGVLLINGGGYYASIDPTAAVKIGSYAINTTFWPGRIGVFQIYNRALSLTEITQNFNAQRNRFGI